MGHLLHSPPSSHACSMDNAMVVSCATMVQWANLYMSEAEPQGL